MKRHIFNQLQSWKQSKIRKPLILQGARQVGKTHILNAFASSEYKNRVYINFDKSVRAASIFEKDLDPHRIISELELQSGEKIIPRHTLIFFDEIQECPNALNSLKYFCEEASEYHVVAAGSLLGVKMAKNKGFPVGKVNFLELYPMTFLEFLYALDKKLLHDHLMQLAKIEPLSEIIHHDLCDLLKIYMTIGGMPEAVKTYIQTHDFQKVQIVHEEIIKAYLLDFSKHAPADQVMKITAIWNSLPAQLAKENKKFVFSIVKSGARAREYEIAMQWLIDAGLIYVSYAITAPKLPLKAYGDTSAFKLYCLDVGILGAMSELNPKIILEKNALFVEFKGALTENLAAQLLKSRGVKQLHYWTSGNTAEVDFILQVENIVQPLEVKAGVSAHKKSLMVYDQKHQPDMLNRANLLNLKQDGRVRNFPLYLLERFPIVDR
ncbi:MAG: hypothetical protein A3E82_04880 [Gammaproteobacteria bacterium RIFCSPHIGHO2_12_FULL_38_11]|nr:MAG: hypothetical protein A3E82_04880 [Gammaproteobacteria bacterium RIFCSPHIGHO2_12_FULL_38_11]